MTGPHPMPADYLMVIGAIVACVLLQAWAFLG